MDKRLIVSLVLLVTVLGGILLFSNNNSFQDGEPLVITPTPYEKIEDQGGNLPDLFPSDFPVYPGAQVIKSWSASNPLTEGFSTVWETGSDYQSVIDFYLNGFPKNGWVQTQITNDENSTIINVRKEKATGFIAVTKGEDQKTVMTLTMAFEYEN